MNRMNIKAFDLNEVRWTGVGKLVLDDTTMIYSGIQQHGKGVGILMNKKVASSIIGY